MAMFTRCRRCGGVKAASPKRLCDACPPVAATRKRTYATCAGCGKPKVRTSQRHCDLCRVEPEYREKNRKWTAAYRLRWAKALSRKVYKTADEARDRASRRAARPEVKAARKAKRTEWREAAVKHYGGHCVCCGETTLGFLQIDHTYRDGADHRRREPGAKDIYWWLVKNNFPKLELRVLCGNCHHAVTHFGACPHDPKRIHQTKRRLTILPISSTLREP